MGIILESGVFEILALMLGVIWIFYSYVTANYDYWKKRGVPFVKPVFPLGSLWEIALGQISFAEGYDKCYQQFYGERFFGIIEGRAPVLVVTDPLLIKHILVKDFQSFFDRFPFSRTAPKHHLTNHLFQMGGLEWKRMRTTLTPTFTSGKIKMMFTLMEKCCDQLTDHLDTHVEKDSSVDVKDVLARLTTDIICTCAFGLEINSLLDRDCDFYRIGSKTTKTTNIRLIGRMFYNILPILAKVYAPPVSSKEITDFYTTTISNTVKYRRDNGITRNDALDLLMKLTYSENIEDVEEKSNGRHDIKNENVSPKKGLTITEITSHSYSYFLAGHETASSTAAFCLYLLARNQDVQDKLYQEITQALSKKGGKPTYEALQEITYLDQVINETLRIYPSLSILYRTCTEPYQIPGSKLILEKGTKISIPMFSIQRDPKNYAEPEKFDPERFAPERVRERDAYLHLPFGEGPRKCIGMRFGLVQTKIALATMISNYKFNLTPETEPVKIHRRATFTIPENPLVLEVQKRNETWPAKN